MPNFKRVKQSRDSPKDSQMPKFSKRFKKAHNAPEEATSEPPLADTLAFRNHHSTSTPVPSEDGLPIQPLPEQNAVQSETNLQQTADQSQVPSETLSHLGNSERRLEEAAKKLNKVIPKESFLSDHLEITGCADINTIADNVASAIGTLMSERNIDRTKQSVVKTLLKGWVKKALPFIQQGLSAASVLEKRVRSDWWHSKRFLLLMD
jgi:hypothetical protein